MGRMITKKAKDGLKSQVKNKVRDAVVQARVKRSMTETPSGKMAESVKQNKAMKSSDKFAKSQGKKLLKGAKNAGKSIRRHALKKAAGGALKFLGKLSIGADAALDATKEFTKKKGKTKTRIGKRVFRDHRES